MSSLPSKPLRLAATAALLATAVGTFAISGARSSAQSPQPPQAVPPIFSDGVAWTQFVLAVTPSPKTGLVTYETFASDQDLYVENPCPPLKAPRASSAGCNVPVWPTDAKLRGKTLQQSLLGAAAVGAERQGRRRLAVQVIGPAQGCGTPSGLNKAAAGSGFPATGCIGEEVRRDHATFDYLVANTLWSQAGLGQYYASGKPVATPLNALEVKADWIPVSTLATWLGKDAAFVNANFYTATANAGNGNVPFAMTSMHIMVKPLGFPDWIWANFENAYVPGRCDQTGCNDSFGAQTAKIAPNAQPWGQYGTCPKSAAVALMMTTAKVAPVFANYCMTGSQSAFGTATDPTLLGSPVLETLNANVPLAQSSCISCHAGAAFNATEVGPVKTAVGPNGPPTGYIGYDLMWGLLFAS